VDDRNCPTATHCDLEGLAREMGVLRPGEKLQDESC